MDLERRLREQLKTEARQVQASPDAWARVRGRLGHRTVTPWRLVLVLGTAAAVAIGVWVVSSQTTVKRNVIAPPARDAFFEGYWPVKTAREAYDIQQRAERGDQRVTWMRDSDEVVRQYVKTLGWDVGDIGGAGVRERPDSSPSHPSFYATVEVRPVVGEGSSKQPGPRHTVLLEGLPGYDAPVWFVGGITDENITVDTPGLGQPIVSQSFMSGTARTFEGNVLVTVVDDSGQKLGQETVTAGGSERAPFGRKVPFAKPSTVAGIVQFEGGSGLGGPSTDVTIVRVRFDHSTPPPPPTPRTTESAVDRSASPTEPDMAFLCFFDAEAAHSFEEAKRCTTDRFIAAWGKADFECCSDSTVERAVIIKSYPQDGRLVYDAIVYWQGRTYGASSTSFLSEVINVYLVRDGEHWLVDASAHGGDPRPVGETTSVVFSFLALGDTPKCDANGQPTPDSFVPIERDVPSATRAEMALSVVREMLTGPWADEGDAARPFPSGTRVESVDVSGNDVHVNLTDTDYRPSAACDLSQAALQRTLRGIPGFENANVTFSTP